MIPGSVVYALHLFYRAQWQTPWGRFHRQLVRSTLQSQREGASIDPSRVSGDSAFPLPIPLLNAEFDWTGQEVFLQRSEQLRECKSLEVARLTNLLCSLLFFFHDGCPQGQGTFQLGGGGELNSAQQLVVRRLEEEASSFCASSGGDIAAGGRGRARLAVAVADAARSACAYSSGGVTEVASLAPISEAVDLERTALPKEAGRLRSVWPRSALSFSRSSPPSFCQTR